MKVSFYLCYCFAPQFLHFMFHETVNTQQSTNNVKTQNLFVETFMYFKKTRIYSKLSVIFTFQTKIKKKLKSAALRETSLKRFRGRVDS